MATITMIFAKLLLPVLAVFGVICTFKLANDIGMMDMIEQAIARRTVPDSSLPMRTVWTGISGLDNALSMTVCIFAPITDGNHPTLAALGAHFSGQITAIWVVLVLESFRVGNAWRVISFITIWGLAMENIVSALIVPIWCFLHLLTSPTAASPKIMPQSKRQGNLLIHPIELSVLPYSIALGAITPAILGAVLDASTLDPLWASKQFWLVARPYHPLFTAVIHLILSSAVRSTGTSFVSAAQRNRDVLKSLHSVYTFATSIAVVMHLTTVSLMICSRVFPTVLAPEYQAAFDPVAVFKPYLFWEGPLVKASSIPEAALIFLQWDALVTIVAPLIWAIALNRQATSTESGGSSFVSMLFKTALMTVVGGPAAAIVSLIKERDQVVLDLPPLASEMRKLE